jgi:hypothetical protein
MKKSWTFKVSLEKTVEDSDNADGKIGSNQDQLFLKVLSWLISEWALYNSTIGYVTEIGFVLFLIVLFYKLIF